MHNLRVVDFWGHFRLKYLEQLPQSQNLGWYREQCFYSSDGLFQRSREAYFNTRVSTETIRHESTYIVLFLTWYGSLNDDKNDDLYTSSPCLTRPVFVLLMTSQLLANNVTMARQLWRDRVNSDI